MTKSYITPKKNNPTAFVDTILDTWDMVCDSLRSERKKKPSKDNSTIILGEIYTNVVCRELKKKNSSCQTENVDCAESSSGPKMVKVKKTQGKIVELRRGMVTEEKAYKELAKTLQKLAKGQEKECINAAVKELMKCHEEITRLGEETNFPESKGGNQPEFPKNDNGRETGQRDSASSALSLTSCPTCNGRGRVERRDSWTQSDKRESWLAKDSSSEDHCDWSVPDIRAECPGYGDRPNDPVPADYWESYDVTRLLQKADDYRETFSEGAWDEDTDTQQLCKQFKPLNSYRSLNLRRPKEETPVAENSKFKGCPRIPPCSRRNCLCCWWHMRESQKWTDR